MISRSHLIRTVALAAITLIAFASNSILCRLALGGRTIDAASFTFVRLASGAASLFLLSTTLGRKNSGRSPGNWFSSFALFLYAAAFSFAYLDLSAGTGALILFGSVQTTMMIAAIAGGERPHRREWTGLFIAIGGLVYLVLPGLTAPPPGAAGLMLAAGVAWGWYTLKGRGSRNPLSVTSDNFARTLPFVIVLSASFFTRMHISAEGALLAAASGSLASGIGYALWYTVVRDLTATRAAVIQLCVPVLAASGGVLFLSEEITFRLLASATLILGGVWLSVSGRVDKRQ